MTDDVSIMMLCVSKALKARGFTRTNPLVGAAVVKNGVLISLGIHEHFGGHHAEVNALDMAGDRARGADIFITLEPCSSFGKTPPCVDKIIACGIKRAFIGSVDVDSRHCGAGIKKLRDAGVETRVGIALDRCALLTEDFTKSRMVKLPYVTLKTAMSADGKIAASSGDSKWITGERARKFVHKMRSVSDAVLTGIGTVLADDPTLNDRNRNAKRQPARIVLDALCRTPQTSNLVKTASHIPLFIYVSEKASKENIAKLQDAGAQVTVVAEKANGLLDIKEILKLIYEKNMMNVLVEAGSRLAGAFYDEDAIDRLEGFIAPKIIGGENAPTPFGGRGAMFMKDVRPFCSASIKRVGEDFLLSARLKDYASIAKNATIPFMRDF